MKHLVKLVLVIFSTILLIGCNGFDPIERKIKRRSVEKDINDIIEKNPALDDITKSELYDLLSYAKDKKYYLTKQKEILKRDTLFFENSIVREDTFEIQVNALFKRIENAGMTYKNLLDEYSEMNKIRKQRDAELKPYFAQIDALCIEIQSKIDEREKEIEVVKKGTHFSIVSIEKTISRNGNKAVAVGVRHENNTGKPITDISFTMQIKDNNGNDVIYLVLHNTDNIRKSDIGYYIYESVGEKSQYYQVLSNCSVNSITYENELLDVTIDGKKIAIMSNNLELGHGAKYYGHNSKYKSNLNGYCPYLPFENEFNTQIKKIRKEIDDEIESRNFLINTLSKEFKIYNF